MYPVDLRRKPPRKLDMLKCENCRQAKKKCVATKHGCARCRHKELECPGRTKAVASSKRSPTLQDGDGQALSSSFIASQNDWKNSSALNSSDCTEPEATPAEQPQSQKHSTPSDTLSEQIAHAMEEIDGLEIGMNLVDSASDDDVIDEDLPVETTDRFRWLSDDDSSFSQRTSRGREEGSGLFWIKGIPSSGKSTQMKFTSSAYENKKASEIENALLSQIDIRCDGNFVCIRPECKLQPFEASLEALGCHQIRHHHSIELLWSWYVREVLHKRTGVISSHLQQAAMTRKAWDSWTVKQQRSQLALDMQRLKQKASGCYEIISQTRQFQDLKALKKAFRTRYTDFLRASKSSPELSEFADMLRSTYRNSRGLHRLGFGVFRKVLAGTAPTTVLEVFAFELLSGAMTNVMRSVWKKDIPHEPQDIDYLVWRSAIADDSGKDLFDDLMNNWFPHFQLLQDGISSLEHLSHEAMRDYILNLVLSRKSTEPPNFSAFSSSEVTTHIHGTSVAPYEMDCSSFDSLCDIKAPPWQGEVLQVGPKSMTVRDSIVFTGVYLFMIFVTERGILVIYLGNPDRRCKSAGFEATAGNILQVSDLLKSKVIDPLLTAFSDAPLFSWLLESAKAMVDCGQTWSVEELHHVLQWTVKGAVQDLILQSQWQTVIDLKCQLAQDSIAPAYGR